LAAGNIAAEAAAKADPDGTTLTLSTSSTFATNPSLYKSLPFDVQADFAADRADGLHPNLLVVHPSVPASTVIEKSYPIDHLSASYRRKPRACSGRLAFLLLIGAAHSSHLEMANILFEYAIAAFVVLPFLFAHHPAAGHCGSRPACGVHHIVLPAAQ